MDSMSDVWESVKRRTRRISESIGSLRSSPSRERPPILNGLIHPPNDPEPLNIKLGEIELLYENQEWFVEGDQSLHSKKYKTVMEKNKQLEAENNLLKFKLEVMLDMLATSKLDNVVLQHKIKENDIE